MHVMDPNLGRSAEAGVQSAYPSSPSSSGYAIFGTVPVGLERVETRARRDRVPTDIVNDTANPPEAAR
jgi:hypothetical protein